VPAGESSHLLVPIINPPFADTAGKLNVGLDKYEKINPNPYKLI